MPDHAPQPMRRPGRLGWLALLPGVLVGFCLSAWMLAIALEWLGDAFFWRKTCASHSEQVLQATWQWWRDFAGAPVWLLQALTLVSDKLQQVIATLVHSLNGQSGLFWTEAITTVLNYTLLSAGNVTLTFLLRLAILFASRRRDDLLPAITLVADDEKLTLTLPENWLEDHPLGAEMIEQECQWQSYVHWVLEVK